MNEITKKAWITRKAWEVFRSAFKDGDQVVVEDIAGNFWWGKMKATDFGIVLIRPEGRDAMLAWEDVEFVCHDGFPVKHIMGMSQRQATMLAEKEPRDIIIRALEGKLEPKQAPVRYFGGGCPFVAGPCGLITIHNRGNVGPLFWEYPMMNAEEMMVFQADDGAIMHSYDTEHLFLNL